jgi:hypothetical protein
MFRMTYTHPPHDERIPRIDPTFDGEDPAVQWPEERAAVTTPPRPRGRAREDAF